MVYVLMGDYKGLGFVSVIGLGQCLSSSSSMLSRMRVCFFRPRVSYKVPENIFLISVT